MSNRLVLLSLAVALVAATGVAGAEEMAFGTAVARSEAAAAAADPACVEPNASRNPLAESSARGMSPDGAVAHFARGAGDTSDSSHGSSDTAVAEPAATTPDATVGAPAPRVALPSSAPVVPTRRGGFRWQSVVPGAIK